MTCQESVSMSRQNGKWGRCLPRATGTARRQLNSAVVIMFTQTCLMTCPGWTMMPEREAGASGPITIDRTSPVPLYFQLAQHFESAIRSGALKVGARLENEVQLAEMLGLSRPTVRAAFLYLANKGLVVRKRGAGTLVANERIDRNVELTSLYDDLAATGRSPETQVLKAEVSHASDQVADALQLPERALVMSLEREPAGAAARTRPPHPPPP